MGKQGIFNHHQPPKAATGKTRLVWVKRPVKDSAYNDHWEFKLADINYAKRYNSGHFKNTNWVMMTQNDIDVDPIQPKIGTIKIQDSGVTVIKADPPKKKVAKASLKIV